MANLEEVPYFTPHIYQLERGQKADGGPQGLANLQPQQLAARTLWLKQRLEEIQAQIDAGTGGGTGGGGLFKYEELYYQLTMTEISARQILLPSTPKDPLKVQLVVFSGIEQRPAIDFAVNGNVLSWAGLALELLVDIGSNVVIRYVT